MPIRREEADLVTLALIAITVAVSMLAWQRPGWLERLIYWPPAVARGEWWRLLTHGFVHADGSHLAFNMITFYFFGRIMEPLLTGRIGSLGFALFYLAAIVIAMLPSHVRHRHDSGYRSLGASGAVSAVLFAYILLDPWAMLLVFFVPVPAILFAAAYVIYSAWAMRNPRSRINHGAHLWGGVFGVIFLIVLEPRVLGHFLEALLAPPFLN